MSMHQRHATILHGLIEEYVHLAEPIGSRYLTRQRALTLSSATVRAILQDLEEQGYLYQPHTSAGRIPTDRGYRSYVDQVSGHQAVPGLIEELVEELRGIYTHQRSRTRAASQLLSRRAHTVAICAHLPAGEIQEVGLTELMDQPEAGEREVMREISNWVDQAEDYLKYLTEYNEKPEVFIGEENPALPMQHTSVVVRTVSLDNGEQMVFCLVGPKRMSYDQNLSLLESMAAVCRSLPL